MTAQQLKNSILQMAVQGKLVPQNPDDEPASVLLQRIKAEKEELIKACKIKKDKKSSEIFRGATHNLPYAYCEQIGKEIRDISDEIPFDIPDSWEWVRLGIISTYNQTKQKINAKDADASIWGLDLEDIEKGGKLLEKKSVGERKAVGDKTLFNKGDILYSKLRPYLLKILVAPDSGICTPEIVPFTVYGGISAEYIVHFLKSPYVDGLVNGETYGIKMPRAGTETMISLIVPLPPLAEQHRIVSKIEELLPYIEKYGKTGEHLTALNTTFPEALKKSILQEAVQGKLVPQNPDDEPASVLLERIRVEKQALIKAGKIKKDKHESVIITRDKIPYEIPDSWEWCKLSDLAILENGDRSSKYPVEADYVESGIPFFGAKDIDGEMMSFQNVRFISQQKYDELGNGKLVDGDIICLLRGSVGKTAKFEANEQFDTGFICAQMLIIRLLDKSLFGYISSYFKSPDYTNYVESKVTGTAVRQMPAKEMGNLLIPLPPLAEQKRIVEKIKELMQYCDKL